MPTSRKRRPRRPSSSRRTPASVARFPDELRPYLEVAMRADAAEARGDARAALAELSTMPIGTDGRPHWRPWRVRRLSQLLAYDGLLPRWATSRWVLEQATQRLDLDARDRVSRAMLVARSTGAADLMPPGLDALDTTCRIMDRDWVFRQVFLFELGGLASFLARSAAPDLVAAADDLAAWMRTPIDAYRFVSSTSRVVTWEHVGSCRLVETANLGAAAILLPAEVVLGRMVPIEGGEMFESTPLRVTEDVGRQVAADPESWIQVLRSARGPGEAIRTSGFDFGMLHDVHSYLWEHVLNEAGGLDVEPDAATRPSELARAALDLVRRASGPWVPPGLRSDRDPWLVDGWPVVAAALLEPVVLDEIRLQARPDDAAAFEAVAAALPEPAAAVCRTVVSSCRSVA